MKVPRGVAGVMGEKPDQGRAKQKPNRATGLDQPPTWRARTNAVYRSALARRPHESRRLLAFWSYAPGAAPRTIQFPAGLFIRALGAIRGSWSSRLFLIWPGKASNLFPRVATSP